MRKKNISFVTLPWQKIFLGVALVATVAGALFATKTLAGVEKNIATAKEAARPANVTLTKITAVACTDCFNLETAIADFKKQNVSVGEEKAVPFDSPEGESLVKQFGVKRVPTYIATGEVGKNNLESFTKTNGEIKDSVFVFTKVSPIFIDAETKKEMGKVVATLLTDPTCTQCINLNLTIDVYKKAGIKVTDSKKVTWNSSEGQRIINQYKITKVPTFLLSSDVDFYDSVKASWARIGTVEKDKTYVARNLILPYRDLEKGQLIGLVDAIYLADSTCSDCYKPETAQKNILTQGFGVGLKSERKVDIASAEGKVLVAKYKITKVPTMLLSPDVDQYVQLKSIWTSVGTVESDGWYVFREMQRLGDVTYKDLSTNNIISPAAQNGQTQP